MVGTPDALRSDATFALLAAAAEIAATVVALDDRPSS
jgi:hypothetical protein